ELGYHERVPAGHTVSRLTSDIEALTQLVTDGFSSLVVNGLTFIGVIVILFLYDWQLALLALVVFPPFVVATMLFRYYSTTAYRRTRERVADVLASLQESVSGMRVVQGFAQQDARAKYFLEVNERYRSANVATIRLSALYFPSVEMLAGIGTAVILFFGSQRVLDGDLTLGVMIAFIGYLASFFDPVQQLSQLYNTFQAAMAALDKIFGVLDTGPRLQDSPSATPLETMRGEIAVDHVTFAYGADPVLHDVTLDIAAGQTVALVGATGAGKSTLAKLMVRFYDPSEGSIRIDRRDLRDITSDSLRAQIAIVPQEGYLFAGTVADNLRFGDPLATDDDLERALDAVGASAFVAALPNGIHTELRERGSSLSVGQRQLLAFARALASDPRLLVLDEATSSVDLRTEARIEDALGRLLEGRTAIVIAHRLSTIRRADQIVVLDSGHIAERGTHAELISAGGRYARLYGDWEAAVS
ncbi:MAG: ABC transporter ATP-binding protein/permease, partial [Thermoleophilia bacterium]|nr:ABC transporter ATP-binding protein/permease [Thermoleophilia bacterium]